MRLNAVTLGRTLLAVFTGLLLAVSGLAAADSEEDPKETPPDTTEDGAAPTVGLDALLRLPSTFDSSASDRRGGAGEVEWRARFLRVNGEVEEVRDALARARAEYDATASESEQWQGAPPGATNPQTSPLSFRLREEMRRLREELDRVEKLQRDLEIEANLAGVPEEWRP